MSRNETLHEVVVCSACKRASCWQRVFICDEARSAEPTRLHISAVQRLGLEGAWFWTRGHAEMGEKRRGES